MRHWYSAIFGIVFGYVIFWESALHFYVSAALCYALCKFTNRRRVHLVVFVLGMGHIAYWCVRQVRVYVQRGYMHTGHVEMWIVFVFCVIRHMHRRCCDAQLCVCAQRTRPVLLCLFC